MTLRDRASFDAEGAAKARFPASKATRKKRSAISVFLACLMIHHLLKSSPLKRKSQMMGKDLSSITVGFHRCQRPRFYPLSKKEHRNMFPCVVRTFESGITAMISCHKNEVARGWRASSSGRRLSISISPFPYPSASRRCPYEESKSTKFVKMSCGPQRLQGPPRSHQKERIDQWPCIVL